MKNTYLQDIVLPYFKSYIDSNINIALFDTEQQIIECSKSSAASMGLSYERTIGLRPENVTDDFIKSICYVKDSKYLKEIASAFESIDNLLKFVIKEKKVIRYIDFIPYKTSFSVEIVTNTPVFNNKLDVVGVQTISTPYYSLNHTNFFRLHSQNILLSFNSTQIDLEISERQHEIIFLLANRLNQNEISTLLSIRRSTVSKIIERLCVKFNVDGINIPKLLERTNKYKFHEHIPLSLYKPRIVILDGNMPLPI